MYDVITLGSATVDVFAKTKFSELIKIKEPTGTTSLLAYPTGTKILVEELDFTTGGGGTNSAVSFSRLGNKTAFLGILGNDNNADIVKDVLKKEKVKDLSVSGKGLTGYSIILDSIEHDRTILAYKGVNNSLSFSQIKLSRLKTRWFYFATMLETSFTTMEKLAKYAEKKKIKTAFNASRYLAEKGQAYLKNILKRLHVLILNKQEAMLLLNKKNASTQELLKSLVKLGPKIAVITDGKNGAYALANNNFHKVASPDVKVVETTGAGDAFASGFVSGLIKKHDIKFGMQLGTANSISVIQHHGAKNKLLKYNEALKLIKKHRIRVKTRKIKG